MFCRLLPCFILFVICGVLLLCVCIFYTNGVTYMILNVSSSSVEPQTFNTECGSFFIFVIINIVDIYIYRMNTTPSTSKSQELENSNKNITRDVHTTLHTDVEQLRIFLRWTECDIKHTMIQYTNVRILLYVWLYGLSC